MSIGGPHEVLPSHEVGTMERHERIEDFRAPLFMEELGAEVRRLNALADVSPEEFASGVRAFEQRLLALLELAPAATAGMCTMMRLAYVDPATVEAMDRERAKAGGGAD